VIESVTLDIVQSIAQPPSNAVELRPEPRRYALCFLLDLNLTSSSVESWAYQCQHLNQKWRYLSGLGRIKRIAS